MYDCGRSRDAKISSIRASVIASSRASSFVRVSNAYDSSISYARSCTRERASASDGNRATGILSKNISSRFDIYRAVDAFTF